MKIVYLLMMIASSPAVIRGGSSSLPVASATTGEDPRAGVTGPQGERNVSAKTRAPKVANLSPANHPKRLSNRPKASASQNGMNRGRPKPVASAHIVRAQSSRAIVGYRASTQLPSVARSAVTSPNDPHHLGPNPAVIGGFNPRNADTGTINGTRVKRKP